MAAKKGKPKAEARAAAAAKEVRALFGVFPSHFLKIICFSLTSIVSYLVAGEG